MSSALDLLSNILSVIGLVALLCQLFHWCVQNKLPRAELRGLEETFKETENLLTKCVEEGRLSNGNEVAVFYEKLADYDERATTLRIQTLSSSTYKEEIRNMLTGLSQQTADLCQEVRVIQAQISRSSSISVSRHARARNGGASVDPAQAVAPVAASPSATLSSCSSSSGASSRSSESPEYADNARLIASPVSDLPAFRHISSTALRGEGSSASKRPHGAGRDCSSSRTSCTPSLRRKKQGGSMSRARALARAARLSYA